MKEDLGGLSPIPLLDVRGLNTVYRTRKGPVYAVNGISFQLARGETLALVGESGCGKSATVLSLLRLLPPERVSVRAEAVEFDGRDLLSLDDEGLRRIRGAEIGMVFQDPLSSLNPVLTIGRQVTEMLEVHRSFSPADARARAVDLLTEVGIPDPASRLDDYPHQFSGGMCQRVMLAMALSCEPRLLIADEPTTALDVTIQAQVLDLLERLRRESELAMIWITHDLSVVSEIADRVAVMYAGVIIETAHRNPLLQSPQHPYTRGLIASVPAMDGERSERLNAIAGQPPSLLRKPTGCVFAERCSHVFDRCRAETPPLLDHASDHRVACWWDLEADRARENT